MSKTELVHIEQRYEPIMPVMAIEQAAQRYQAMVEFTKRVLKENVDFGKVPGTEKPCLLKPGAEKLTTLFGLRPEFELIEKTEDWTGADHNSEPFFYYWFRCSLWRGDQKVGEADGSCNSHESKYRWRWVEQTGLPPRVDTALLKCRRGSISEFAFAIDKAETSGKYGKPPEYWQQFTDAIENKTAQQITKQTRDGRQYPAWKIDTTVYRVPNDDIASQVNTVLKMAQKRALIAATLITVNASEFFTQDMEDYVDEFVEGEFTVEQPQQETTPSPSPSQQPEPSQHKSAPDRPYPPNTCIRGLRLKAGWDYAKIGGWARPSESALTWDDLANEYDRLHPGAKARTMGMDAIFDWAREQRDKFTIEEETGLIYQRNDRNEKSIQRAASLLESALKTDDAAETTDRRYVVTGRIFGVESLKNCSAAEVDALLLWAESEPGSWEINEYVQEEALAILNMRGKDNAN